MTIGRCHSPHRVLGALLLLLLVIAPVSARDDLTSLRVIEQKVQAIVETRLESCVAITDGIGFGSGVVVSPEGLVLTAGHVIQSPARRFEIIFPSGKRAIAERLGMNLNIDAGMLQIVGGEDLPSVPIAKQMPQIGDWVVSLGHSGGFELGREPPVRTGRILEKRGYQWVTDAVLIGGDSGGPLFNLDGELVGIHSSIGSHVAENRHVRVELFQDHWSRLAAGEVWGKLPKLATPDQIVDRPKLGVVVDKNQNNGQVLSVRPGSPAELAGILPGDRVIEFDGQTVRSSTHLIELVKQSEIGDVCSVTVVRNGRTVQFDVRMRPLD